jgi:hypothetical protein
MQSNIVRFRQYTAYSEKKRKRGVKRCVFDDNAVFAKILNVLGINTYINKFFEILGLSLVYY